MRTSSRNVVCVTFDEFELFDLAVYAQALSQAGKHWNWRPFKLHIVGKAAASRSTSTLSVQTTCLTTNCPKAEILFVPGGYGARVAMRDAELLDFVRAQATVAEQVVSVAQGSLLLGATGIVAGTTMALTPAHSALLATELSPDADIRAESGPVCTSGKFVSAAHSAGAIEASFATISQFLDKKLAEKVKQELGFLEPTVRF